MPVDGPGHNKDEGKKTTSGSGSGRARGRRRNGVPGKKKARVEDGVQTEENNSRNAGSSTPQRMRLSTRVKVSCVYDGCHEPCLGCTISTRLCKRHTGQTSLLIGLWTLQRVRNTSLEISSYHVRYRLPLFTNVQFSISPHSR